MQETGGIVMETQAREWNESMTADDKKFFQELGKRMAQWRKERGLTQAELAELLGISQQSVASYEVGRLRIAISMLPKLARVLGVPVDALLGLKAENGKRGPTPKLQQQLERISRLPRAKQRFVMEMLDTVISQASR
jgi:transcriptional regulator with XRE-family HTH domain